MNPRADVQLNWDSVFVLPYGATLLIRHPNTALSGEKVETDLHREGLRVQRFPGFIEADDGRTVFVGYNE